MMRIVHLGKFYHPAFGGIETAVQQLAEAGVQGGHEVRCVVSQDFSFRSRSEVINGVEVKRLATFGRFLSAPLSPYFFESLAETDVVHVHLPHPLAEASLLLKLILARRKPTLVPYFHSFPIQQGRLGALWFKFITTPILNAAKAILISNRFILEAFPQIRPWKDKVRISPFSTECISSADFETRVESIKNSKTVVAVGRLVGYKGYHLLLRAWALVLRREPSLRGYRLHVIGGGPEYDRLLEIIQEEKISDSAFLEGHCTDEKKSKLLAQAAMFVAPSVSSVETFGISILEAMGQGLSVVTTSLGTGVAELARGGECGEVVAPGSIESLADAMARLLLNSEKRTHVGQVNLEFVRRGYSFAALKKNYMEILNSL
jgi:rhamnosyl/mannosyltransferase